jgi:hypothetical protein
MLEIHAASLASLRVLETGKLRNEYGGEVVVLNKILGHG